MFDSNLFRPSAIQHYLNRERDGVPVPLRIAPAWTWWLLWIIGGAISLAILLSISLKVEVRSTGRGVLQIASGARPLVAQITGRVARVATNPGQMVADGDLIMELESATLQSQLLEAERALTQFDQVVRPAHAGLDRLVEAQIKVAKTRREAQQEQLASQEQSVRLFERKYQATEELSRHGLVSTMNVQDAKEALAQAQRSVNSARQAIMEADQEIASLQARREGDMLRYQQEFQVLRIKRDSLVFAIAQTRVTAPEAGLVEGLHVRPGDMVNANQTIGRLLTGGGTPRAYALLSERDRAQIEPGDTVRLEFDQYPVAEWGVLKATILRIGESPASLTELREVFGENAKNEGGGSYLVEMSLSEGQARPLARQPMQSGMGFQARYTLRRQRPITFLLEPLRRWLE